MNMRMPSVEQANEKRILHSIRAYFEGERNCTANWLRGIIGVDAPLANHFLLTTFRPYAGLERYQELQTAPVFTAYEVGCRECGNSYQVRCRMTLGVNSSVSFLECRSCGKRYPLEGEIVSTVRLNESTGAWETIV